MRQYSHQLTVRCASPIFKPIAYKLSFTNRKRKYFEEQTRATLKIKQTSNHLRTLASFLTPLIFHWSLPLNFSRPGVLLPEENILFLAGNTSALGRIFSDQERKIPGYPEISEVCPARKSLISGIPHSRMVTGIIH